MLDVISRIAALKRPALLARAARFGADDYRRAVHLPRILKEETPPRVAEAIMRLLDIEAAMESRRKARAGDYSVELHVEVLIALSGEARLLQATAPRLVPEIR